MKQTIENIKIHHSSELENRGFEVTLNEGNSRVKGPTLKYREEVDAALVFADIVGYGAENNYRIRWKAAMPLMKYLGMYGKCQLCSFH